MIAGTGYWLILTSLISVPSSVGTSDGYKTLKNVFKFVCIFLNKRSIRLYQKIHKLNLKRSYWLFKEAMIPKCLKSTGLDTES